MNINILNDIICAALIVVVVLAFTVGIAVGFDWFFMSLKMTEEQKKRHIHNIVEYYKKHHRKL